MHRLALLLIIMVLVAGCEAEATSTPSASSTPTARATSASDTAATTPTTGAAAATSTAAERSATTAPAGSGELAAPDQRNELGERARLVRVVDGDTIIVQTDTGEHRVRMIGVDTPESVDPNSPVMCYGKEATAFTEAQLALADGWVYLEGDVSNTDRYDRLLRYVWMPHPDGNRMLNYELVAHGYAVSSTYPPDVKHQEEFTAAQQIATTEQRGLWQACGAVDVPAEQPPTPVAAAPSGDVSAALRVNEQAETATIINNGAADLDVSGWTLVSVQGGQRYRIPSGTVIPAGGSLVIASGSATGDLKWTSDNMWNNDGDPGQLLDASGNVVAEG